MYATIPVMCPTGEGYGGDGVDKDDNKPLHMTTSTLDIKISYCYMIVLHIYCTFRDNIWGS